MSVADVAVGFALVLAWVVAFAIFARTIIDDRNDRRTVDDFDRRCEALERATGGRR